MPPKLRADEDDADDLLDRLTAQGLDHLRVRHRADVLTVESGRKADPIPHLRFRRATVHYWTLECATHTGKWERTGHRDTLERLVKEIVTTMPWTVAPIE